MAAREPRHARVALACPQDLVSAFLPGHLGLVRVLGHDDEPAVGLRGLDGLQHHQADRARADYQHGIAGARRAAQDAAHADGAGLDQAGLLVANVGGHFEEAQFVRDDFFAPARADRLDAAAFLADLA